MIYRRFLLLPWLGACLFTGLPQVFAQDPGIALTRVMVEPRADAADLVCVSARRPPRPAARPAPAEQEMPDEDESEALIQTLANAEARKAAGVDDSSPAQDAGTLPVLKPVAPGQVFRMAIWGDSHLAAGFFTDELQRQLKLDPDQIQNAFVPANMNRPGVRLPLRRSCVGPGWRHEPVYVRGEGGSAPGPGLVNLVSAQKDASLAWDLRSATGTPGFGNVRILYQQTDAPILVGVSVDGGEEKSVRLAGRPGPGALELAGTGPLSVIQLRLLEGQLRLHGLALPPKPAAALQMDVFGYPGATAASWNMADQAYLSGWFANQTYQLVALEFGTNEGNAKPFDAISYRAMLTQAVRNLRTSFPSAVCVLIAPGDRGVYVRSVKARKKGAGKSKRPSRKVHGKTRAHQAAAGKVRGKGLKAQVSAQTKATRGASRLTSRQKDLLLYTRIHQQIGHIQEEVAQAAGCRTWSMFDAMGGPGSAYQWAHASPALMAPDLIHFTVAGYQTLARLFAKDMGWSPEFLWRPQ